MSWRPTAKWLRVLRGRLALQLLAAAWSASKKLGLRRGLARRIARYVAETGLFDSAYYLEVNPDVRADRMNPALHYLRFGDREGRLPMALFDPDFYRAHSDLRGRFPPALIHYSLLGRHLKVPTSAWFDTDYYLKQNRDVARSGEDPLLHFLRIGGLEGRSPTRQFDCVHYMQSYPEVAISGLNPLVHFLMLGRLQGREPRAIPEDSISTKAYSQENPLDLEANLIASIEKSRPPKDAGIAKVSVIIPVFGEKLATLRCLCSVLSATCETPFEIVVVDDAGPDASLRALLRRFGNAGLFRLIVNERNRGFVHSVNRGMQYKSDRDVVLLNSDTEVWGDWMDRLRNVAYRHARTGTVTPLSNNATIASYPRFLHDNPYPLEITGEQLDSTTATVNAGVTVEAPTGVGFCMYIRSDCLADVGLFDENAFGKGYGEENDFCQRAIDKGWSNLISAEVFVWHFGGLSFKGEKAKRIAEGLATLRSRYPGYERSVKSFIDQDPLSGARNALDTARLKAAAREHNVLIISHNRGGGSERHVQEDSRRLQEQGTGVFYLRPVPGEPGKVRVSHPSRFHLPNLPDFALADTEGLVHLFTELRITGLHNHGLVDFEADAALRLLDIANRLDVAVETEVHDYHVICPRLNLADASGMYCGEPDASGCNDCLQRLGNKFGVTDIVKWRATHGALIRASSTVWVPDSDAQDRLARYFPDVETCIDPHEKIELGESTLEPRAIKGSEALRIVVIGAIGPVKGFSVLQNCARDARRRSLPVEFSLLGYSMDDAALSSDGVLITGKYLEHEAVERLRMMDPHVVWIPSTWPETYSYTLSLALQSGYPAFCFDIGAMPNRLRAAGLSGYVIPLEQALEPARLNDRFVAMRERLISLAAQALLVAESSTEA